VRGHAAEFGIIAGKGAGQIVPLLSAIEQEAAIPPGAREMFAVRWTPKTGQAAKRESRLGAAGWSEVRLV
jgi:hypothetical protein